MTRRGPIRPPGETRRLVAELREQGFSYSQIAEKIGARKSTVAYHARRLGIPANYSFAKRYDWIEIQEAYNSGLTMGQCQERFGFNSSSWSQAVGQGRHRAATACQGPGAFARPGRLEKR